jgi:hypothetical protein
MTKFLTCLACSATFAALVVAMQSAGPSAAETFTVRGHDPLAQVPRSGLALIASRVESAAQARMRRCMQDWGPATQMTKREWKSTCKRVIKQQPGTFGPDPL